MTALPVALLVRAPLHERVRQSFAQVFSRGTASGRWSASRRRRPIRCAPSCGEMPRAEKWLGTMHLAYTREQSGATGESLEGRLLELDRLIERTFENRER